MHKSKMIFWLQWLFSPEMYYIFLKSVKNKKLQNTTFNPWTTKWLNPPEASQGQKQFFFPDLGGQGEGKGKGREQRVVRFK